MGEKNDAKRKIDGGSKADVDRILQEYDD